MLPTIDGFWLPKSIHAELITPASEFAALSFKNGLPCKPETPGAITVRYPIFSMVQWHSLLTYLQDNRNQLLTGAALCERLSCALDTAAHQLVNPNFPMLSKVLETLPGYTGYSTAMLSFSLHAFDVFKPEQLQSAINNLPTWKSVASWQGNPQMPGQMRFYPERTIDRIKANIPGLSSKPLYGPAQNLELLIGFGAGNVPGTGLLLALLALSVGMAGKIPPAAIIKNSRSEPIFSPLMLQTLEAADPDLVSSSALLIWDFEDPKIQELLFTGADLVIVAASDQTINSIKTQTDRFSKKRGGKNQFHAHGHKVSFTAVAKDMASRNEPAASGIQPLIEKIAFLAALDSAFWDQNGCLSSRVHFVETGEVHGEFVQHYADSLNNALKNLASSLPRGAWGYSHIHDRFDFYKQLEGVGLIQVLSSYQDPFLVIIDYRKHDPASFTQAVNDCQGRVVIVQPVANLMEIPIHYLNLIPPNNLQSLSVAVGSPGSGLEARFLEFAAACGKCGVTAIRTVGRAAFPQLAYSWDGMLPLDLVRERPPGYFTTIEFDSPFEQILETFQLIHARGLDSDQLILSQTP